MISANGTGADNMTSGNNVFGADADRVSGGASLRFAARPRPEQHPGADQRPPHRRPMACRGKAVDLNTIPMAAIARIEILKDGASAIYGTDAVGGVINFILRPTTKGVEATASGNFTEHGGGATAPALMAGKGNLQTDGFNVMARSATTTTSS
jgi:iron complex outermembrane receptor protein